MAPVAMTAPMVTRLARMGEKAGAAKRRRALSRAVVTAMAPSRNSWGTKRWSRRVATTRSASAAAPLPPSSMRTWMIWGVRNQNTTLRPTRTAAMVVTTAETARSPSPSSAASSSTKTGIKVADSTPPSTRS